MYIQILVKKGSPYGKYVSDRQKYVSDRHQYVPFFAQALTSFRISLRSLSHVQILLNFMHKHIRYNFQRIFSFSSGRFSFLSGRLSFFDRLRERIIQLFWGTKLFSIRNLIKILFFQFQKNFMGPIDYLIYGISTVQLHLDSIG